MEQVINFEILFNQVLYPLSIILSFICLVRLSLLGVSYENEMKKEKPNFKTSLKLRYSFGVWFAFPIFIITKSKSESARLIINKFNNTVLIFWILVGIAVGIKLI